ncbi:uncharacterized protein LOC113835922 [Cricetulus griseus]|uniref:Uncharacterized protein LOC113835922 n=1 Tax=Cricetulus griseus TaxID=10029 RepID=A0A9J7G0G3_CRIGR|nr:uncharacterized protein LOC113835922 [Cricetulus griseus]
MRSRHRRAPLETPAFRNFRTDLRLRAGVWGPVDPGATGRGSHEGLARPSLRASDGILCGASLREIQPPARADRPGRGGPSDPAAAVLGKRTRIPDPPFRWREGEPRRQPRRAAQPEGPRGSKLQPALHHGYVLRSANVAVQKPNPTRGAPEQSPWADSWYLDTTVGTGHKHPGASKTVLSNWKICRIILGFWFLLHSWLLS